MKVIVIKDITYEMLVKRAEKYSDSKKGNTMKSIMNIQLLVPILCW